ncbi:MAG: Hsp20/alpha crystallin family protein [Nitrososphaerales archaeon]
MEKDEAADVIDEIDRKIRRVMREAFELSPLEDTLYDEERRELRPLAQITETDDEIIVSVDLPCVTRENIELKSTHDTVTIRAKMTECVRIPHPGRKEVEYETYRKSIKLPGTVDPTKAEASFKSGMLQVRLPKKSYGSEISVE